MIEFIIAGIGIITLIVYSIIRNRNADYEMMLIRIKEQLYMMDRIYWNRKNGGVSFEPEQRLEG